MSAFQLRNPMFVLPVMNGKNTAVREMTTNVVDVRPEQAERWLAENGRNRPFDSKLAEKYAADMVAGNWSLHHQGIAFSPTGTLLDGQHRLHAVVRAGVTVRMNVSFNVQPTGMLAMDSGKKRRFDEQMTLLGSLGQVRRNDVAILRAMIGGMRIGKTSMTFSQEKSLLEKHWAAISFAHGACRVSRIVSAPVRGAFARAYYCVDHEKITEFATAVADGIAPPSGGDSVGLLTRWILNHDRATHGGASRVELYGRTSRAIIAFIRGERISKLVMPSSELFPLPDEAAN